MVYKKNYLIYNLSTEIILNKNDETSKIYPASLTKLMLLYIIFDNLQNKKINLKQVIVCNKNYNMLNNLNGYSKLNIKKNEKITIEQAILSQIIISACDVSILLAEFIEGTEIKFVKLMNLYSKKLNMVNTNFENCFGKYHLNHYSTCNDLLKLSTSLITNFNEYYYLFKKISFDYNNKKFNTTNTNTVKHNLFCEGLKTGYTKESGYNLITTARINNNLIIGILIGCNSKNESMDYMIKLLL